MLLFICLGARKSATDVGPPGPVTSFKPRLRPRSDQATSSHLPPLLLIISTTHESLLHLYRVPKSANKASRPSPSFHRRRGAASQETAKCGIHAPKESEPPTTYTTGAYQPELKYSYVPRGTTVERARAVSDLTYALDTLSRVLPTSRSIYTFLYIVAEHPSRHF